MTRTDTAIARTDPNAGPAEDDRAPSPRSAIGVTPEELRNIAVRETLRGYHRQDVDALCARAAETIEHLQRRHRELAEHLAGGAPRRPAFDADPDVIQRTLLLAQRVADESVAEAEARAASVLADAEERARTLVSEAESTARRVSETERRRVTAEIVELRTTRDALTADVAGLEQFAAEYRDRIREAVEAELERIGVGITEEPGAVTVGSAPSRALEPVTDRGVM